MIATQTRKGLALSVRPANADTLPNGARRAVFTQPRHQWAMLLLHAAKADGVTRAEHASTSLPRYVWAIRQAMGDSAVRTVREMHHGKFPGPHARYFLMCEVAVEWVEKPKRKRAKANAPDAVPPDPVPDARKPAGGNGGPSESNMLAGDTDKAEPTPSQTKSQAEPDATGGHDAAA